MRDRKSEDVWIHLVPLKGVTHPYPARVLKSDLDFMEHRRVILKSDQEPSIVAFCDGVKNGWHGEIVPEASPKVEEEQRRGRTCRSICTRTCENSQRLRGPTIWNHVGVAKSAVGLVLRALFQSSPTLPQG